MKNSWSCRRATFPRTQNFHTVLMQDRSSKHRRSRMFSRVQNPKGDIPVLANVLQLPVNIHCPQRTICDRIEGLCTLLRRVSYLCRYSDMISRFGIPVPELCMVTIKVMDSLLDTYSHRILQWKHDNLSPPLVREYADAIHANGTPLKNVSDL